ncbi:MAG TPA: hypothetical protein VL025_10540, partial [Thermoanaerobaculia bacterium]|nr:hypothetical protein [Thermoanaerobaculia bacterium]
MRKSWSWFAISFLVLLGMQEGAGAAAEENAPAVVLLREAELRMAGYGTDLRSKSSLLVTTRVKILTEEGRRLASMRIPHNRRMRIESLEGRTILPDGRVVPL